MTVEFKLPELGENIDSADVVKVLIKPGDRVELDQTVLEIETDKANVEVPSEVEGIVKEVFAKEGEAAKVGSIVFTVDSAETAPEVVENKEEKESPTPEPPKEATLPKTESGISEMRLPELGENIESADVVKVLVAAGDKVTMDQTVLEIETDKANVEVPSEVEGVVEKVFVAEGKPAKVGEVIFTVISEGGKEEEKKVEPQVEETEKVEETPKVEAPKVTQPPAERKEEIILEQPQKIAPAAPSVRRFAREIGIDINRVSGSGPGGRISVEDVKAFAKYQNEKISKATSSGTPLGIAREPLPDFSKWGEVSFEPMSNVRKKTAEHLSYAWNVIPHVTQFDKADITELEKLRKQFAKNVESEGGKLTVTAILLKIVASAMKAFPQFNSSIDMEKKEIIYKKYVNIGVAVDTDRGLLVPVIRDVDKKNITTLSKELSEISVKAGDKKLTIEDMQGGNFSISNLGGIGGTYFTPIVNSPEVAILGVSRGAIEPKLIDGKFEPRLLLPLSLSYDHRIIDGADGARFIRWIANALENPFLLSLEG